MRVEPRLQRPGFARVIVEAIAQLAGISRDVVELRSRCLDVLPRGAPKPSKRRPSHVALGQQRLHVRGLIAHRTALDCLAQRAPVHICRHPNPGEIQHRRHHINAPRDHRRRAPAVNPGPRDDERHPQRGVVHEHSMCLLAVLAEALAVVRRHDDQCAREITRTFQTAEQSADLRVHERHLTVVQAIGKTRRERRRRCVWCVRIEVVDPREPRLGRRRARLAAGRAHLIEPTHDTIRRRIRGTLRVRRTAGSPCQPVIVDVEARCKAEPVIERKPRHECGAAVPRVRQPSGERANLRG